MTTSSFPTSERSSVRRTTKYRLLQGDCLEILEQLNPVACIFADPPDNIGANYESYNDRMPDTDYLRWMRRCLRLFMHKARIIWLSFNSKWTFAMGRIFDQLLRTNPDWEGKPCVQVFTFGQHNHHDLGNNHRPLWRLMRKDAPLFPDAVRILSWRQENGDKRADPRGRVPGDVFDFTRVTGNSKQRRKWHPTQLNEELVERCIALSTKEGERVLDPFAGTGTTLRVCKKLNRRCTLIEIDRLYCRKIAAAHRLKERRNGVWK